MIFDFTEFPIKSEHKCVFMTIRKKNDRNGIKDEIENLGIYRIDRDS